ncbi:MAG TPA: hypothetical protein VNL16_02375 [Chloroflexota bacterium]|nr:hypothetical protein [Chloroflexota bacterium]
MVAAVISLAGRRIASYRQAGVSIERLVRAGSVWTTKITKRREKGDVLSLRVFVSFSRRFAIFVVQTSFAPLVVQTGHAVARFRVLLSGGQIQRAAAARTLVRAPELLAGCKEMRRLREDDA